MSVLRMPFCFCIVLLTSLNVKAQAISLIPFRKASLQVDHTSVIERHSESEANWHRPFTYRNNRISEPLCVANGKIIAAEDLSKLNPHRIDNIIVLKGKDATDRFGSDGANGAIIVAMKKHFWFYHKKSLLK